MEYRSFGASGLKIPVLSFGTATFGGVGDFFKAWGAADVAQAKRLVDICLEHGVNFLTPPTFTPRAKPRKFWALHWRAAATRC